MQNKRKVLLYSAAVGAALVAAVMAKSLVSSPPPKPAAQTKSVVRVLTVTRDINAGETIAANRLRWSELPRKFVTPGMIQEKKGALALNEVAMARARVPLFAGEPVMEQKLLFPEDGGYLSSVIAPGMRAIAFEVRVDTAVGGYVRPNDRVDIFLQRRGSRGSFLRKGSKLKAELVLKNVKVLAVDEFNAANTAKIKTDTKSKKRSRRAKATADYDPKPVTAVLEITPKQAKVLAKASIQGRLVMALRSLADKALDAMPELVGRFAESDDEISNDFEGVRFISRGMAVDLTSQQD
ncbi:MAG TPA: Flp pilus assembly protein CpaB [Thermopetrobacter sp.]|nr:Flp pilus assembly protein CpaB [Thermopetrobacter sp.]